MKKILLKMNPRRVCFGLSRIGYTPESAICDIVDNAVDANAKNIFIFLNKINDSASDRKINNIKEYLIIDDGIGMTSEGIVNALDLGSDDSQYVEDTLSKFGLGLKSASFAQGDRLEVISGMQKNKFYKLAVDLSVIDKEYFATEETLSKEDIELINKYIVKNHGTIIRITKIHQNNHPSIRETKEILKKRLGIIYYYFLKENLRIVLDDNDVESYDALFTNEADVNGNLDETDWDGKSVKWISKKSSYIIDTESNIGCEIEVTQLPYPPIYELDGEDKRSVREKYNISAKNYGYYVYRNKRLISWAEGFNGLIPQNQNYYSFRGRILINSDADDCFNIDVKKANLALSDEAYQIIETVSDEFKRKSNAAWEHAKRLVARRNGQTPNQLANDIASEIDEIDDLPYDTDTTEQENREKNERKRHLENEFEEQLRKEAKKRIKDATGKDLEDNEITEKDISETLNGNSNKAHQIFQVSYLEDNVLWMPYYDAEKKSCVRINQNHRFAHLIYEDNTANDDLQIIIELLLWQMAKAEVYVRSHYIRSGETELDGLLKEYRRVASEFLADLCRNKDVSLPPFIGRDI